MGAAMLALDSFKSMVISERALLEKHPKSSQGMWLTDGMCPGDIYADYMR